ncbi:unnamed protein product, partial [Urochloa humidicola]
VSKTKWHARCRPQREVCYAPMASCLASPNFNVLQLCVSSNLFSHSHLASIWDIEHRQINVGGYKDYFVLAATG